MVFKHHEAERVLLDTPGLEVGQLGRKVLGISEGWRWRLQ